MASKWKGHYDSGRKFQKEWVEKFPWLRKASDGSEKAFCRYCHVEIVPRTSSFTRHEETKKHKQGVPDRNQAALLQVTKTKREKKTQGIPMEQKTADLQFAVFVACHTTVNAVDHLGELVKSHGIGSNLGKIRLHRTKCASLIRNVISPSLKYELKQAIEGKKYVLIIDESTDVSVQKLLCATVMYLHDTEGVQNAFLGLIPVLETNAETLFATLEHELLFYGLTIENCIGFASDGASVMVGKNNSVWTRIRNKSPDCKQMKCICHSLALCIQHAFGKLPSNLGFLLKEIPSWFSHSNLRRDAFVHIFNVMNADTGAESGQSHPTPFSKTSATRWLVRGKILYNILVNWDELVGYFTVAELSAMSDCKFKARLLKEMLQDKMNLLLFYFATPVVQEFERVNAMFQSSRADPYELSKELLVFYKSLKARLYDTDGNKKDLNSCDMGFKFQSECIAYLAGLSDQDRLREENRVKDIKIRCQAMLEEALLQVERRLPDSIDLFHGLSLLNPQKVLSQIDRANFIDLPFRHLIGVGDKQVLVEEQYRKIAFVDWAAEPAFNTCGLPEDAVSFWEKVNHSSCFKELANYALTCLITPTSNASIERIFSLVTSTKTKPRNRLAVSSLDAIIRIKANLYAKEQCCVDFKVTPTMLELFSTQVMYVNKPLPSTSRGTSDDAEFSFGSESTNIEEVENVALYL